MSVRLEARPMKLQPRLIVALAVLTFALAGLTGMRAASAQKVETAVF